MERQQRIARVAAAAVVIALVASLVSDFVTASARAASAPPRPPAATKRSVEHRYFGTTVRDDYQWMEDWRDPSLKPWVAAQNAYTRGVLDKLPSRTAIRDRVAELSRSIAPNYTALEYRGGTLFALKDQPPKNQPMLVALASVDDLSRERVIVNPNAMDPTGAVTIDFLVPSLDGSKVAVSLSKGGTESGDVHVFEVATGREQPDVLPRVNGGTAGGSVAWTTDGSGLLYTRYPAAGERPAGDLDFYQQAWFHKLGTPRSDDTYLLGRELPKIAEIAFESSDDGRYVCILVRNGDGGEIGWWLRGPDGALKAVAGFKDRVVAAEFGGDGLFLLSRAANANGEVLRVPLGEPALEHARSIVPASETAIDAIHVAGTRLYVEDIEGGPNEMRVFALDGKPLGKMPLPPVSSVDGFARYEGEQCLVRSESYTEPGRWLRYDPAANTIAPTALALKSPADFSGVEVRREFVTSRDGTRVPVSILVRKGVALDGKAPLLLYGYGGYGISMKPNFEARRMLWIEQGGIYAVAHIRGGREYGDAWHEAGKLLAKQNVFDDFAACAQALVDRRYTSTDRLAIMGGSNGGLLMGAELTQHPNLPRVVVSQVGVYDMLRSELSPNGLFNTTEYGTVRDSAQFRALLAYSPYHHVHDGTRYPSTLLLTGVNDPRVAPSNSFKFAARLQASGTTRPVLLRTSMTTGHVGTPLNARNEEYADIYSFIFSELDVPYRPHAVVAP
ncbi:MAG TPA: prolyl oligopeptidase family serine peptidase [Candidatus Eisenbacteria bacterium]|jgi:prolyl oligopeptidase